MELTLGGIPPNVTRGKLGDGAPVWMPCLTRARDDEDKPTAREHVWFIGPRSLYCEACRATKPRAVVGPRSAIAAIRTALERGDRALVAELVNRLSWTTAPMVERPAVVPPAPSAGPRGDTPAAAEKLSPRDDVADMHRPARAPAPAFRPRDRDDWTEYFTERAAIFEYLGEYPRQVAEAMARELAGAPPRFASAGPLFAGAR